MSFISKYYPDEPTKRITVIEDLWEYAKTQEPRAEEGLSYGLPALKLDGRPLIGFSIAKEHMTVYPFSPKVISALQPDLGDYSYSKGLIRFSEAKPISKDIIAALIELRKEELK